MKTVVIVETECCHKEHREKRRLFFGFTVGKIKYKKGVKKMPLTITINDEQQVLVSLNPVDQKGKPANVFGIPTWTVTSGPSTVQPAADGLSCLFVSSDTPSETVVAIHAEGDSVVGTDPLDDTVTLEVTTADAVSLGLSAGAPTDKP